LSALNLILRLMIVMVLLPFAPTAEERILASRIYESSLSPREMHEQLRARGSLLGRLRRAAHRQRVMNEIYGPEFEELQRRKWERAYSYMFLIRRLSFWLSLGYAGDCLEAELMLISPGAAVALDSCAAGVVHLIESFWKAVLTMISR